jgi:hypothetical protein
MDSTLDLSCSSPVVPEIETEDRDDDRRGPSGTRIRCHDAAGYREMAIFGRAPDPIRGTLLKPAVFALHVCINGFGRSV